MVVDDRERPHHLRRLLEMTERYLPRAGVAVEHDDRSGAGREPSPEHVVERSRLPLLRLRLPHVVVGGDLDPGRHDVLERAVQPGARFRLLEVEREVLERVDEHRARPERFDPRGEAL